MAAEYEVNIKINSQQITRQLEDIDKAIGKIGKPKGGGSSGRAGISALSPAPKDLKAAADYQRALQGVAKAGRESEKVFATLRKTAQAAMVAGANEAKQLAAAAAGAPLRSGIETRATAGMVTRQSADAAAKRLESQIRARATLEKQVAQEVAVVEARADKRVLKAALNNDKIEFKQKIDDIVRSTNFAIRESKREGKAFDAELKRRDQARRKTQQNRTKQLESVALGAGFPLLFGGGAGSVLGGGLGGLTGSFGAQIAFSAIGQQVDQFVAGVVDAGKALTSVGGAFDMMTEKSLFSSDQMQHRIETLIEEGRVTEAAALMTEEMARKIGGVGMQSLKDLGTEANKMGELFSVLIVQVQAFIARALTPLLRLINKAVGGIVLQNQYNALLEGAADPAQRQKIVERANELRGSKKVGRAGKGIGDLTSEVITKLQADFPAVVPKGAEIKPTQLELIRGREIQLKAAGRGKGRSNRDAERERKRMERLMEQSRERIRLLDLQIEKNAKLFGIQEDINEANFYGNKLQSLQLQSEKRILEINYQRDRAIERINDQLPERQRAAEALKITEEAQQEISMERLNLAHQIRFTEREQAAERAKNMEKALEMQYKLNEAVQQQLALADGISNIMGQGMTQAFDALIDGADNWGRALQDIAANVLRDIARQLIQIYVIEQAIGFMKNLLSPSLPSPVPQGGFGVATPEGKILTSAAPRANGGSVSSGRPYFVGERGPELFVPGASGNIVPNHAMGGANVTVNVDASGTQAQGNQPNAKLLGQAIGAAVQAELIKQKRPGGLLAV